MNVTAKRKTKPDRDYSRPLDRHKKDTSSADLRALVTDLEVEIRGLGRFKGKSALTLRNLRVLILNLFANWKDDPDLYTGMSRNENKYKVKSRYNKVRVSSRIIEITDALRDLGYLEFREGVHDRKHPENSRNSRIRPRKKLTRLFEKRTLDVPLTSILRAENEETMVLKDRDPATRKKFKVEYKDSEVPKSVNERRANLAKINAALHVSRIELDSTEEATRALSAAKAANKLPDLHSKKLHRVFNNNSWEQGGRFYGAWWVRAPKKLRKHILIGNSEGIWPAVEIDFSTIHVDFLYAKHGINFHKESSSDPYTLVGYEDDKQLRNFCKIAVNILFNAKSKPSAIKAVRKKLKKRPAVKGRVEELGGIEKVLELFEERHSPIKGEFYSRGGAKLQFMDSEIAERVMLSALEEGFIVLPVHDSFLCAWKHSPAMYRLMVSAYQQQVRSLGGEALLIPKPYPRVKRVPSKYDLLIWDYIQSQEVVNIQTDEYEAWLAELAVDAANAVDDEGDEYDLGKHGSPK